MATNNLGHVALGDGDLDGRRVGTVDHLERNAVGIVDDAADEILNEIGDTVGDELLRLGGVDGLINEGSKSSSSDTFYSSEASAAAAASSSALRAASSASLASCFLDFLGAAAVFSPSLAAFTRAATASVS